MKTLLLMRHGKSSWKDETLEDHERPLKKRGRKDSARIAREIRKQDLVPDLILCSSATAGTRDGKGSHQRTGHAHPSSLF